MKLLSRNDFKTAVFKRDNQKCVVCKKPAVDAHHLLERKLFPDGGYYLENGASLCSSCHLLAEQTILSVEELRRLCQIVKPCLPPNFLESKSYDKWGNEITPQGIIPGPLFHDQGCQKNLASKKLSKMSNKIF